MIDNAQKIMDQHSFCCKIYSTFLRQSLLQSKAQVASSN